MAVLVSGFWWGVLVRLGDSGDVAGSERESENLNLNMTTPTDFGRVTRLNPLVLISQAALK